MKPYARATGEHLQAYEALLAPHPVLVTWTKRALYFDATRAECWGSGSCVTDPVAGLGEIMKCFNHLELKSPDRQQGWFVTERGPSVTKPSHGHAETLAISTLVALKYMAFLGQVTNTL